MRDDIQRILDRCGGLASRALLLRHGISRHAIDNEVRSGALVALAPGVYCRPWDADQVELHERAALVGLGRATAISHLSGLRRWGLPDGAPHPVHVSVPARRAPRQTDRLAVHRVARFPPVVRLDGLVTVTAESAIVTSWPLLGVQDRRAPAIEAVRQRLVTPAGLGAALEAHPRLPGRARLLALIALLQAGCESELEMWGHSGVFDTPGLRHGVRQKVVRVRGQAFRLDLAYEVERVAVELDGRRYHFAPEQRERDMRRDALLATEGWLTLRYSHHRLHTDVAGCRRDTLAVLAARGRRRAA